MIHKPDCVVFRKPFMANGIQYPGRCTCDHKGMIDEIESLRHRIRIAHALNMRSRGRLDCECDICKP